MSSKPSVFLSHSWGDKPFVRAFAERLVQVGVNVWLDEAEIAIGDSLVKKISEGIEQVDYVAAIISKKSVSSGWVQKELSLAMTKEIQGRHVVVLPVVIERCELPAYLRDKLFADFTNPAAYEATFSKFLEAIGLGKPRSTFGAPKTSRSKKDAAAIEARIRQFNEHIDNKHYDKAFQFYFHDLSAALYESGDHRAVIETLNAFYSDEEYALLFLEPSAQALVHNHLARAYKFAGKTRRAMSLFERSLGLRRKTGEFDQSVSVIRDLSRTLLSLGDFAATENYLREGLGLAQNTSSRGKELGLHRQLGVLYTYEGRFKEAADELRYLPQKFRSARHSDISPLSELCLNALLTGNAVKALHNARDMHRLATKYQHKTDIVEAACLLGRAYLLADDLRRAEHHVDEAFALCKESGFVELEPDILIARARCYTQADDFDRASQNLSSALAIAKWSEYKLKEMDIQLLAANVAIKSGNKEAAGKHALNAYALASSAAPPHRYKIAFDEASKICSSLGLQVGTGSKIDTAV